MTATLTTAGKDLSKIVGRPLQMLWEGCGDLARGAMALRSGDEPAVGYVVGEQTDEPFPGRQWLLAKQDKSGETYRVECGPLGWRCTCDGFKSSERAAGREYERVRAYFPQAGRQRARCKHTTAMEWLLDNGHLDPTPVPALPTPTAEELDEMFAYLMARAV